MPISSRFGHPAGSAGNAAAVTTLVVDTDFGRRLRASDMPVVSTSATDPAMAATIARRTA